MKNWILLLLLSFPIIIYSQTINKRLEKAKILIRQEFKENMNDYSSYTPVSYGNIDSLFTSPFDEDHIKSTLESTIKAKIKAGAEDLKITDDVTPIIEAISKEPHLYKDGALEKYEIYSIYQKMLQLEIQNYVPQFIGWKVTHKYRAKNSFNAITLYQYEFRFNKEMTQILSYTPIK